KAHLYQPNGVVRWRSEPDRHSPYGNGARRFVGQNPPQGAQIYYSLTKKADKLSLKILDYAGKTVREMRGPDTPGLHKVPWNLTRFAWGMVGPGTYRLVLSVDGEEFTQSLHVENDPAVPNAVVAPPPEPGKEDK